MSATSFSYKFSTSLSVTPPDAPDAPRDLLDQIESDISVFRVRLEGSRESHERDARLKTFIPRLVQRVRTAEAETARLLDVLDDFAHAAHAVLHGPSYVGTTEEQIAAARHRLSVFAGTYDRPVASVGASRPGEPE